MQERNSTKRYTIFNLHIQGSNMLPQSSHGLNNLWKSVNKMSDSARHLFYNWAYNGETEIMLRGGNHKSLVELLDNLKQISDIPSASFFEEDLNGSCTLVTFVASDRIVSLNNYIRQNRLTPANALDKLQNQKHSIAQDCGFSEPYTDSEIFIASKIAFLSLV